MGVNEGSLQVIGKLNYSITIRHMLTSSACGVCNSHYILHLFVTE